MAHNTKSEDILVVTDWDNVITLKNGDDIPLREAKTANHIAWLYKHHIPLLILTTRHIPGGSNMNDREVPYYRLAWNMGIHLSQEIRVLDSIEPQTNYLDSQKIQVFDHSPYHKETKQYWAFGTRGIIFSHPNFAGIASTKGPTLADAIDSSWIHTKPHTILFIDDLKKNIESVQRSFQDRPEKVYLFHFPMEEEELPKVGGHEVKSP